MLVTTCTHCRARFRVSPAQLNEKQGQVRCGRCRAVFNGFEVLERYPDDDTGARLLAAHESHRTPAGDLPPAEPERPEPDFGQAPVSSEAPSTIDLPVEPEAAAAPEPEVAAPGPAPIPEASSRRPDLRQALLHLEPPVEERPSRAWAFGALLVALVLALESVYVFRAPLAQRYPVLRPALEAACGYAQCTVPWSREESLLKLEESEMLEVPGKPREIALGARIRNLASVAQEYPYLELTLSDTTGQPAARRVLRPTDYLGRPLAPGEAIAAGAELALQMRIETPRIKPTGYELLLFYP